MRGQRRAKTEYPPRGARLGFFARSTEKTAEKAPAKSDKIRIYPLSVY